MLVEPAVRDAVSVQPTDRLPEVNENRVVDIIGVHRFNSVTSSTQGDERRLLGGLSGGIHR